MALRKSEHFTVTEKLKGSLKKQANKPIVKKHPLFLTAAGLVGVLLLVIAGVVVKSHLNDGTLTPGKIIPLRTQAEIVEEAADAIRKADYQTFAGIVEKELKDINAVNSKGSPLILVAAGAGNIDAVNLLFRKGADINKASTATGDTAIMAAMRRKDKDMYQLLRAMAADFNVTNKYGHSPLILAVAWQDERRINEVLGAGGTSGASVENLLNYSARRDKYGINAMLRAGIKPNIRNKNGFTPLIMAASFGETDIVGELLNYRADIDERDYSGATALLSAAKYKHPETLSLLLTRGADPDIQDHNGETALYWASANNMLQNVPELIEAGANPTLRTRTGVTPRAIAEQRQLKDMVAVFDKYRIRK